MKHLKYIFCCGIMALFLTSCGTTPSIGLIDNKLTPCPNSPNCVSSFSAIEDKSYVEPILYKTSNVIDEIKLVIDAMPRTKLQTEKSNYLHYEFRTFLGFIDDVEFYIDSKKNQIHFRSASRLGHYDFNKNRNRYIAIKKGLL